MKLNHLWSSAVLVVASCGGSGTAPELELTRNLARWQESRPASYVYALERLCFCAGFGVARVTVEDAEVIDVAWVDPEAQGAQQPSANEFPSVDGLFEILAEAMGRDAHVIEVTYDPVSGVPMEFFIDYVEHAVDEELRMRVTEPVSRLAGP